MLEMLTNTPRAGLEPVQNLGLGLAESQSQEKKIFFLVTMAE